MESPFPLARARLVVGDVSWRPKLVRTVGPSGPLHEEWTLTVRFACATQLVRAVAYVDAEGNRVHSRGWADGLAHEFDLSVTFFPFDWSASDLVQINEAGEASVSALNRPL